MRPSEPFPHFVDDYLAYLCEVLPSQASQDGVHLHDDLLEDFSGSSVEAHVRALAGFGRRLRQIDTTPLPPPERVEHRIVASNIEARMHDLETVRTWARNPQLYADTLGTGLAGQALFAYAPEAERAGVSFRSCARRRGSCRRPATTSVTVRESSSRSASKRGEAC